MSAIILFYHPISTHCRAVLMVAKTLRIPLIINYVDIFSSQYRKTLENINPEHTLPTIKDGGFYLWESHAITRYLVGKFGNNERFYPKDLRKRSIVDQRLHFDTGVLYPALINTMFPVLFRNQFGISSKNRASIGKCYDIAECYLKNNRFICGNDLTLADFSCITNLSTLDLVLPANDKHHPRLVHYLKAASTEIPFYDENISGLNILSMHIQRRYEQYAKRLTV